MTTVNVRYMVDDVDAAIDFYTTHLGFRLLSNASPAFADVARGDLRLLLSGRTSSAGRAMPDGRVPGPGGWNRIEFVVEILLEDPSGNPIELFQPRGERRP
jgi:catechol 2,3-dioxygenase-like lactoylglutathione lyase family enzyme